MEDKVYWMDDGGYVVEAPGRWDVGEETPFAGSPKVIRIEDYDPNEDYEFEMI